GKASGSILLAATTARQSYPEIALVPQDWNRAPSRYCRGQRETRQRASRPKPPRPEATSNKLAGSGTGARAGRGGAGEETGMCGRNSASSGWNADVCNIFTG